MYKNDYLKKLNKNQLEAVTFLTGPALVIAGPGSGKTSVLTYRVARLLEFGVSPDNILLLTFTNKAAKEMLDRVSKLDIYEEDKTSEFYCGKLTACTYHSFCSTMLRKYAKYIDYENNFTIIDSGDTIDIINLLLEDKNETYQDFPKSRDLLNIFNGHLNTKKDITDIVNEKYPSFFIYNKTINELFESFQTYKKEKNLMTYDDLLINFLKVLETNIDICESLSDKFKFIMVDEYQDSNILQNEIIKRLRQFSNKNIMVVGDEFQSIYGFNYADIKNILNFPKLFSSTKLIILNTNYRSNQEIVDVCNNIILSAKEKFDKKLEAVYNKNQKPFLIEIKDKNVESFFIVSQIKKYIKNGTKLKDIAVLIRNSRDSLNLEVILNKEGIAYEKFGGIKFLEKKYIKDIFSFLKIIVNEKDELSWFRILSMYPNIGFKSAKNIANDIVNSGIDIILSKKYQTKKYFVYLKELHEVVSNLKLLNLTEQLKYLVNEYYFELQTTVINLSKRKQQTKQDILNMNNSNKHESFVLFELSKDYKTTLSFLNDIVLNVPNKKKNEDFVSISTIHSAKGLEYEIGFILDCIDGTIPCIRGSNIDNKEEEEERRVFYVAISRIKKDLYVLYPKYIYNGIRMMPTTISRFLQENNTFKFFDYIRK